MLSSQVAALATLAGLAVLVVSPAPLCAQIRPDVSIAGGAAFTQSNAPSKDPGLHLTAAVGLPVPNTIMDLRAEGSYTDLTVPVSSGYARSHAIGIGAAAIFGPRINWTPLRPYFVAGAGEYAESGESGGNFGVSGGAGVWFDASPLKWFAEVRLYRLNDSGHSRFVPIVLGLRF